MVELVALVGHRHRVDDLAISGRAGLHIDHRERVGLREVRAEQQSVGEVPCGASIASFGDAWKGFDQASSSSLCLPL